LLRGDFLVLEPERAAYPNDIECADYFLLPIDALMHPCRNFERKPAWVQ
jgi:hypothetical protein